MTWAEDSEEMQIVVTSASGANGEGLGAVLRFGLDGRRAAPFPEDAGIVDPRGIHVHPDGEHLYVNSGDDRVLLLDEGGSVTAATPTIRDLNPGGGVVAPDGRYCVGSRTMGTLLAFPPDLRGPGELLLPRSVAAFPRGFAFAPDGRLFLAAGASAAGDETGRILVGASNRDLELLIDDPELSPLDLTLAPNGNLLVSSEFPFGSPNAVGTVREYDPRGGELVRVFAPDASVSFRRPRGLRFAPEGCLCCVARDEVVAFDFETGRCLGALVRFDGLHGQALEFFPRARARAPDQ
jgi:DNA-binding beta-propeller fold protein YncE